MLALCGAFSAGCELIAYDLLAEGRGTADGGRDSDSPDGGRDASPSPCATDNGGCGEKASCIWDGEVHCVCDEGYERLANRCVDVNECARASTNDCHANADCTNTPGSYSCACKEGFQGDGRLRCDDVDECATGLCDPLAICENSIGSFHCECPPGYDGDGRSCAAAAWAEVGALAQAILAPRVVLVGSHAILAGGRGPSGGGGYANLAQVWSIELREDGTAAAPVRQESLLIGVQHHCMVRTDSHLYVIGGFNAESSLDQAYRSEAMVAAVTGDGTVGEWGETTPLPRARYGHACVTHDDRIYVLGGEAQRDVHFTDPLAEVLFADVLPDGSLGPWTTVEPLPEARVRHTAQVLDGWIHVGERPWTTESWETPYGEGFFTRINSDGTLSAWTRYSSAEDRLPSLDFASGRRAWSLSPALLTAEVGEDGNLDAWEEIGPPAPATESALVVRGTQAFLFGGSLTESTGMNVSVRLQLVP